MQSRLTDSRLANLGANSIFSGFKEYQNQFNQITSRAKTRFENRDWEGIQADSNERLDLYRKIADLIVGEIRDLLEDRIQDMLVWAGMKAVYSGLMTGRNDWDLGETFYNSITRRIFTTVGVNSQIEFVDTDFEIPPTHSRQPIYRTYSATANIEALIDDILSSFDFQKPFQNKQHDIRLVASEISACLKKVGALRIIERCEMISSAFYRGQGAYLVGRLFSGSHVVPICLVLHHQSNGIFIDTVLLTENEISIVFSFTRSYFLVDIPRPFDLVAFLSAIMPRKRIAELYISLGFNKHGKTELYRNLLNYLATTNDHFEIARGKKGMVMTVFTLPGYDRVFKLIKDRFTYPKTGNRGTVMSKYYLIFKHDRAGRLVDAQEFEYLKFDRSQFSAELLQELQEVAAQTVEVEEDFVIIKHAYIERRVIPLDIYVEEATEEAARAAIVDYGNAIKDMAATNIFPGDMMLKNFGVTRHGRVIFYDYDEVCLLTQCNFRKIPTARTDDEMLSPEPWYSVGENDVFPEEFRIFMGLSGDLLEVFCEKHEDLFDAVYWREIQEQIKNKALVHIFPYPQEKRLVREFDI